MATQLDIIRHRTALEQISARLDFALEQYKPNRLSVRVGESAALAIRAQMQDRKLPHLIKGVKVQITTEFPGWEVYADG